MASRKKPKRIEETITLLTVAGQATLTGAGSRVGYAFVSQVNRRQRWEAIEHGNVSVAAGHLAIQTAGRAQEVERGLLRKRLRGFDVREFWSFVTSP